MKKSILAGLKTSLHIMIQKSSENLFIKFGNISQFSGVGTLAKTGFEYPKYVTKNK